MKMLHPALQHPQLIVHVSHREIESLAKLWEADGDHPEKVNLLRCIANIYAGARHRGAGRTTVCVYEAVCKVLEGDCDVAVAFRSHHFAGMVYRKLLPPILRALEVDDQVERSSSVLTKMTFTNHNTLHLISQADLTRFDRGWDGKYFYDHNWRGRR